MKDLQEATERICELKGSLIALDALMTSLLLALPDDQKRAPIVGRSNEGKPGTRKTRFGKKQQKWGK